MFLKVCARYAKDMEDAEQLLNDGFMKIFTHIDKFGNTGSFEGWMRRIMINTCLDYLRSSYLKDALMMKIKVTPAEESPIAVSSVAIENIEFKELVKLIQQLPPTTRVVFNMYVFDGYSHVQIGEHLKMSEKTSQWHLHHARLQLQKKLKKNDTQKVVYETKRI
jgi:RNA polymerase sigma-70 factor (ECF subfamily)